MSATINLHGAIKAECNHSGSVSWVVFKDDEGHEFAIFVPFSVAAQVADTFNTAMLEHRRNEQDAGSPWEGQ